MAWRECHVFYLARVPGANYMAATVGIFSERFDDFGELIDTHAVGCNPVPPLSSVNAAEVAGFVRPFIPDTDLVFLQVADIGITLNKPKKLVYD